jgi:hypothetical protein
MMANNSMEITYNSNNIIIEPNFHDANLFKCELKNGNFIFGVKDLKNIYYNVTLTNIKHLIVNNFRKGNIILDVYAAKGNKIYEKYVRELLDINDPNDKHYQDVIKETRNSGLILVKITPSYGCEMIGLCSEILIEKYDNKDVK